jgi:hypothetical protein
MIQWQHDSVGSMTEDTGAAFNDSMTWKKSYEYVYSNAINVFLNSVNLRVIANTNSPETWIATSFTTNRLII